MKQRRTAVVNRQGGARGGSAREAIANVLRAQIIEGVLQPGEILDINHLADSIGTSRTPLREALIQLEHEGLIELEPQRWTRVTPLSVPELTSFYPVWVEFQVLAVHFAIQRGCPNLSDIEAAQLEFRQAVEQAAKAPGKEVQTLAYRADARFHAEILQGAENKHLSLALAPLSSLAQRYDFCYFGELLAIGHTSIADHEQILDALKSGDEDTATQVMRVNAARTFDLIERWRQGIPVGTADPI